MADVVRLHDVAMVALRLRGDGAQHLPRVGKSILDGSDRIVATGPDEWLAIADDGDVSALMARLESFGGCAVDVSGNRARYRATGLDLHWFLAAGTSIDVGRLEPDDAVSTVFARAQVLLIVEDDRNALLLPRRSFAHYIEQWAVSVDR